MPIFDSAKGDIPWYGMPNTAATLFGGGGLSMQDEGTLYRQVSVGVQPGAIGADNVLMTFTLPPGSFDGVSLTDFNSTGVTSTSQSNRGIAISAQGSFAVTANNKRIKIIVGCTSAVVGSAVVGGVTIADTGAVTTSGAGWAIGGEVYKYGAAGSNTQIGVHQQAQIGGAVASLVSPQALTLNEAGNIIIALTGNATTVVSDIAANLFVVSGMN